MKRASQISFLALIYIVGIITLWHFGIQYFNLPTFIVPYPGSVFASLGNDPIFYLYHFSITAEEAVSGAAIGFVSGLLLGIFLRFGEVIAQAIHPIIVASQIFPKEALAPIFLLVLGFGIKSKVAISSLISFFPVVIATHRGLLETPTSYVNVAKVIGANGWNRFFLVQLPYAAPYIFSSLRLCVTLSVIGAIVGEFVGSSGGLGYLIRLSIGEQAT